MSDTGYKGTLTPNEGLGDFNALTYLVWQILARINTATLVKVTAVTNTGGVSPVGFVDVQPLVNQLDGSGKQVPHGVVHQLPYLRMQGGANAVILDPQAGDIGIAVFASRDISTVKSTKAQANPGSDRMFRMADGLYIGGVLNGVPTQYIQFDSSGITINSQNDVTVSCANANVTASASAKIDAPSTEITGTLKVDGAVTMLQTLDVAALASVGALASSGAAGASSMTGDLSVTGDVTANGTSLHTHVHGGVTTGSGDTGAPV